MSAEPAPQMITSTSDRRKTVPIVTVESFYKLHADKLQMKLEGPRVGFHRKIREPTINRPGLELSGFFTYFKSLPPAVRVKRFRDLCGQKIPCLVVSRGAHLDGALLRVAEDEKIAVF